MELARLDGPLEDGRLADIARLYGPYNRKYADPGFCRRLFDGTPHRGSVHAFLLADGRAVGHYAVIPMEIVARGERRLSGKGEAFVVEADHRRGSVTVGGRPVIAGAALQLAAFDRAAERGLEPIHMIAAGDVAVVHRMSGCRPLGARHRRSSLVLRPDQLADAGGSGGVLRHTLSAGQRTASAWMRVAALPRAVRILSGDALTPGVLERISADLPAPEGWSIAISPEALQWMKRCAELHLLTVDDSFSSWALVTGNAGDGRTLEVLGWRERGGMRDALSLLDAAIRLAGGLGDVLVGVSHRAAPVAEERDRLRRAAGRFLLREREPDTGMLVRTRDPWFLDASHLAFSPFFYGVT